MSNNTSQNRLLPIGIDPGHDTCGVAFLHPDQDIVLEEFLLSNRCLPEAEKLLAKAARLAQEFSTQPVFVLEATNVFWRPLASWLRSQGALVHVVSSKQTHANRSTGMRKTKTDLIDAALIARLYKQHKSSPPYLPQEPYMSLRELSRLNAFLVDIKSRLQNRIHTVLYQINPIWTEVFAHPFTKGSLALMQREWVHPRKLADADPADIGEVLKTVTYGKQGPVFAQNLQAATAKLFTIQEGEEGFSFALKCLAEVVQALDGVLDQLDTRLARLLTDVSADVLQTIPGMSSKTTASFVGELGDPRRFASPDKAVAWFGMDPSLEQSGFDPGTGRKWSKAGSKYGRRTMYLVALSFMKAVPQARRKFQQLVRAGRSKKEALCILAADLVKVGLAMLKSQQKFDPKKV